MTAIARTSLEEFIGVTDPMPYGHAISEFQEQVLDAFAGKRLDKAYHVFLYKGKMRADAFMEVHGGKSRGLVEACFQHAELTLRFLRLDHTTQDSFLECILTFFAEHEGVRQLELRVKWGTNSTRTMLVEREDFDGQGGTWTNINFSLW
ncbi:MAG TPA: hypothetical protein VEA36_03330 [Candidatus Paceibacterota bacterium]|nr:hypothetical protein [Candidatus Paceibacterota bacterium]